eukprot:519295-Pelagomonas_calceolata.AAC.2
MCGRCRAWQRCAQHRKCTLNQKAYLKGCRVHALFIRSAKLRLRGTPSPVAHLASGLMMHAD